MASADVLTSVGFEKSKIGSGDKEVGYQIKESSLSSLVGSIFLCFMVMGLVVVVMVYDVRLEKKTLHKQVRHVEHHAASKLAQVQMELWSQYRDDVSESKEASVLLKHLENNYGAFQGKFQDAVNGLAKELNLNQERAAKFAEQILHLVADMQQDNVKHAKHLLDHLVQSGKKGKTLSKHIDKEIVKNAEEEHHKIEEDGVKATQELDKDEVTGEKEHDPLEQVLKGFWEIFNDYNNEFGGKVRENFKKGGPIFDQVKALQTKIRDEANPISEQDISAELDKIDLASAGAPLGQGRILPVTDIVEELFLVPTVPFEMLQKLQKAQQHGEMDTISVFSEVEAMHEKGEVPSGWLQMGVNKDEKAEEAEEDAAEAGKAAGR